MYRPANGINRCQLCRKIIGTGGVYGHAALHLMRHDLFPILWKHESKTGRFLAVYILLGEMFIFAVLFGTIRHWLGG